VAKRDGDRDDLRPAPQGYAIEIAHELREEVVGIQFLDEQFQKLTRTVEFRRACGEQAHSAGAQLLPPPLRFELLFRACGVFELRVDVVDQTKFAHGCTSNRPAQAMFESRTGCAGGLDRPRG
jgi:hypothetical protein